MNITLTLGIAVTLYLCYAAARWFSVKNSLAASYRKELRDLMTNAKYQVKGRFE